MRKALLIATLLLLFLTASVVADGDDEEHDEEKEALAVLNAVEESGQKLINYLLVAFAIILLAVGYSVVRIDSITETEKKIVFGIIALMTISATLLIIVTTVQENLDSVTGGPVHWHADYEIWVCGEKLELQESSGFEGRIGNTVLHHHNDNRVHVEGTVREFKDVSLGVYFLAIGGKFNESELSVVLVDGSEVNVKNGELCNREEAKIQLYVNGEENKEFGNFVLSPFSTIPPGDFIHIVFDSEEGVPNGG